MSHAQNTPLLIIAGPTAVGKTELCLSIAERAGAEIVGADSVQIYRGLRVGSAQPSPAELARVPHHLVDAVDPAREVNAAQYAALAEAAIAEIAGRGKRVLVTGGTGLYLKALLFGLAPAPPADPALRQELAERWDQEGPDALHRELAGLDQATAARLHPNDRQRVLRALEVCRLGGRPLAERLQQHAFKEARFPYLHLALCREREELNARIARRAHLMWEQGLLEEVRGLLAAGLDPGVKALATLGYRQALAELQGRMSRDEAIADTIKTTRAYAKRQMTWFRGAPGVKWLPAQDAAGVWRAAAGFWGID